MKKLLPFLALAFILFGCKKSEQTKGNEPQKEETKYKVNFTVTDFTATTVNMSTPSTKATTAIGDTVKNYADKLYYRIYNSNGVWVNAIDQESSSANFGIITDQLPSGTYTVFIAATTGVFYTSGKSTTYGDAYFAHSNDRGWNDTFTKVLTLTVGSSNLNQPVRLERAVAGLQVVIEDAIPTDAAKIVLSISESPYYSHLDGSPYLIGASPTLEYALVPADKGVKNKTLTCYIAQLQYSHNVIIRAYSSTGSLMAEKTVSRLMVEKNKRTILSGTLFPTTVSSSAAGFSVAIDPIWGASTTVKY